MIVSKKKHKKQISTGLKNSPLNFTLPEVQPPVGTDFGGLGIAVGGLGIAVGGLGIAVGGLVVAGQD